MTQTISELSKGYCLPRRGALDTKVTYFFGGLPEYFQRAKMSDLISSSNYPSLKTEYLEILPNLSNKILYQEIPSSLPNLTVEEKVVFLNTVAKFFIEDNSIDETKFRITYLDNDVAPQAIRQISPQFSWVRCN